ncbi:MAG: TonB-dependent receptor [Sphingomonadaceae bacterium]|nr:TonB-dependent receptor [Sphingomonadaceae bacterium]
MILKTRSGRSGGASRTIAGALLGSTILAGGSAAAHAQEAPEAVDSNIIIVTAQRRTQDLQVVPLSIQVLGNEQLEDLQIGDFQDYARFLPSVSTQEFGGPSYSLVYMRGVASGGDGNHSGPLPSVGTYLDEQPITTNQGNLNVHLYDIARVEALAGPQGTLYGASSQAGTLRIITNRPDPGQFEAGVDGELNWVDHGDPGGALEGFINVPIGDSMAVRAVGWYVRDGGYIDNIRGIRTFPTSGETDDNQALVEDDFNDVETFGGRVALGIDLDENWTITPAVMAQEQTSTGSFGFNPRVGDLNVQRYRDDFQEDRWYQAALTIEGSIGDFDLVYAGAYINRDIEGLSDYSDYAYFYDALASYGYYFVGPCDNPNPFDPSCPRVNPSQYFESSDRFSLLSQELRVTSPQDSRIRAVAGLFYQRQFHDIEQRYKVDGIATAIEVPGRPDTIWLTKQDRVDRDRAVFGELAFDVVENLTLTGGLRYYRFNNTLIGFFGYGAGFSGSTGESQCFGPPTTDNAPCTNLADVDASGNIVPKRSRDDGIIHRLNLTWQATPDHMAYATWSRGFRPGGINRRGFIPPYGADFLTNYELGFKTEWFDGRLRWNTAFFHQEWSNFQFAILGPNGLTEIRNAAQARVQGLETDVVWRPVDGLTISGAMSLIEAELTENYCGFLDEDNNPVTECEDPLAPTGTRLPVTPRFKGNMIVRYEFPLSPSLEGHAQVAGVYQSSIRPGLELEETRLLGIQDGYGTVDIAAGAESEDGWRFEAYVTNLLDERGSGYVFAQCASAICATDNPDTPGLVYTVPNQPRTFGLRVGRRF